MGLEILKSFQHPVFRLNQCHPSVFGLLINEGDKVFVVLSGHTRSSPYIRVNKVKTSFIYGARLWEDCSTMLPQYASFTIIILEDCTWKHQV